MVTGNANYAIRAKKELRYLSTVRPGSWVLPGYFFIHNCMGFQEKIVTYPVVYLTDGAGGFTYDINGEKIPGLTGQGVTYTDNWEGYTEYIHISS